MRRAGATLHTRKERATECSLRRLRRMRPICHSQEIFANSCARAGDEACIQDYFLAILACYSVALWSQAAEDFTSARNMLNAAPEDRNERVSETLCERRLMTFQRVMLMATLLTPVLGGCAANLDLGMLYAAPGKYDYLRCEDLPARLAASISREKQLNELIRRANQEAGGQVVSAVTYSADLAQVRADQKVLRQAAIDKKCGSIEPPEPKSNEPGRAAR